MRQIILDTETTGLSPEAGHRIIEIGCVELFNRRPTGKTFHTYLQPDRDIEAAATNVHGITNQFLVDKPRFADIAHEFKKFIKEAELIIHNAPFDVGFIEHEFILNNDTEWQKLDKHCTIVDTLLIARKKHPSQRNNLDALCKRYGISNEHREKHGALLDAYILADVYCAMTGGQNTLFFGEEHKLTENITSVTSISGVKVEIPVIKATSEELALHEAFLSEHFK